MSAEALLEVKDLTVEYRRGGKRVLGVSNVTFSVAPGQAVGLVGESGSGKTTIGRAILGLVPLSGGTITFDGVDVTSEAHRRRRSEPGQVRAIFQDPYSSLNPSLPVGVSVAEEVKGGRRVRAETFARIADLFERVGLPYAIAASYPAKLSGGQRQRIAIARALMSEPRLIVCDEPVSALDVSVQAQVLNVLRGMRAERNLSTCFIGHDLDVVRYMSDWIIVLYRGQILEDGPAKTVAQTPRHPYTQALVASAPKAAVTGARQQQATRTRDPRPEPRAGEGCPFAPRCPIVSAQCWTEQPPVYVEADGGRIACHNYVPEAARAGAIGLTAAPKLAS
ncbi:ABC transporter ATP-binding protein [Salinibacterium sp. GXW1014]|uniref:ABC transporter ATP-binding protein n=1 Tax=Salinibacterium sp. GXW1014 TaxID=3377838 RepID=UPI00383BB9E8